MITMKLNKREIDLLILLKDGWKLHHTKIGITNTLDTISLHKEGEIKQIKLWGTFNTLLEKGIIEHIADNKQTIIYSLTELGKNLEVLKKYSYYVLAVTPK